jgi:iron complex transport system ATP-binding protein
LTSNAIELRNVGVVRNGSRILSDVDLSVAAGDCCAILGPNGSGKSSLLAVLSGYLWPSTGTVAIDGQVYGRVVLANVRRSIGLIEPSRIPAFSARMCVREVVATGLFGTIMLPLHRDVESSQWQCVDEELVSVGMDTLGDRAYGDLSSGEQMKTLLARAMVARPRILLLDEPTVGLDMGSRASCIGALDRLMERAEPPTVVIVSHHLDELPRAVNRVALMKNGRIVELGAPRELLTSTHLSTLFDCRVDVLENDGRFIASVRPAE